MNVSHPEGLVLLDAGLKGHGVFATRSFRQGEEVLTFGGALVSSSEIVDFTHTVQVGADMFLGPSGDLDDYVNHCCAPSCLLRTTPAGARLVALGAIEVGSEITFDYSTSIVLEPPLDVCLCGAPTCRGKIGRFDELDPLVRARYQSLGAVPAFVLEALPAPRLVGDLRKPS